MIFFEARVCLAARGLAAELTLEQGEVAALIGPNGSGKSSLLKVISGLLDPDQAHLRLSGRDLAGRPAHRRRIVQLTQQPMLFPHLTLLDNVAFAPRSSGRDRRGSRERAEEFLALVGIADLAVRRPAQVSGGQAQRAAIARALAADPELLLLDEPFAALDVEVASELRQVLRRVLRETRRTTLIVTHDLLDTLALAERILVLEQGKIVEDGPLADVLSQPLSRFGARFAGVNLVSGSLEGELLQVGDTRVHGRGVQGRSGVVGEVSTRSVRSTNVEGVALFRPAAVSVHVQPPHGSPRNSWLVRLSGAEAYAEGVRLRGTHPDLGELSADITAAAAAELNLTAGDGCWFVIKAQEVELLGR